jgi:hypothetical protein
MAPPVVLRHERGARHRPDSELVLVRQAKPSIWHNGGGLAFGRDDFLHVDLGDEGLRYRESGDSFIEDEGSLVTQQISTALFSGVLRIDVDQRGGVMMSAGPPCLTRSASVAEGSSNSSRYFHTGSAIR